MLQRENRLPDLAPERGFIAAEPFENSVIEVGQTQKAARKVASTRGAPGLEDFDNIAPGLFAVVAQDICRSVERMGFQPKLARQTDGLETGSRPPVGFLAGAVQFAMVCPAQRDREFLADLEAETAGLREPQMVGVAGLAPANEARLFGDEPQVGLVTQATRHGDCQHALIDAGADLLVRRWLLPFG